MSAASNSETLEMRVLIFAPSGRDAQLALSVLENAGIQGAICENFGQLCSEFQQGAGTIVISEEALLTDGLHLFKEALTKQEAWSDIPLTILTHRGQERQSGDIAASFGIKANVNLLERTFKPSTLISVLRTALRARAQQYKVRALVERLQQSTENLQRSNSELEQFAYISSHDLQEPLRTITNYVDLLLLRQHNNLDEQSKKYLAFMQESALHAQELISGLLDYADISKHEYPFAPFEVEDLLKNALKNLSALIEKSEAEITYDPLPFLNVNNLQITQLFQNLISNAIKYHGPEKPRIHISVQRKNGSWIFEVSDNGIGIAPEFQERIFMIFKRLHSRHEYPGTGIGLAVCKKIVERHGGEIGVKPGRVKGTTFYFTLPALKKAA